MRKWEDIVKEKLEGYGSTLPEGSLADFRARRDGGAGAPATKRFPLVWALAPALAVLAAVLFLRQPAAPDEGVRLVQQPAKPVPVATDSSATGSAVPETALIAQAELPKADAARSRKAVPTAAQPARNVSAERANDSAENANVSPEAEAPAVTATEETTATAEPETAVGEPAWSEPATALAELPQQSPFMPEASASSPARMNVGTVAAVSGGGLLGAAALSLLSLHDGSVESIAQKGVSYEYGDPVSRESFFKSVGYCFPLRLGLSARFPLAGRWNLTTGLDYSLYTNRLTYPTSVEKWQVHYLGIPVRLDWTLLAKKRWEIYVGAGVEGDICLAATFAGRSAPKDGFNFSLLGAGGLQFNLSKRLGLYVEPQLSWTVPSRGRILPTYRTQDPVVFTVNSGIRITFNK